MAANNVSTTPFFRCDVDKSVCAITLFFGRLVSSAGFAYRFLFLSRCLSVYLFVCMFLVYICLSVSASVYRFLYQIVYLLVQLFKFKLIEMLFIKRT